jgi:ABC-type phosphate transport system substrate-binding protein
MRTLTAALVGLMLFASAEALANSLVLAVIVNPSRPDKLDRIDVARIYLRTRRFWSDGSPIVPLNLEAESPTRVAFTSRVFSLDPEHLAAHWNAQYFHGIFPPTVLTTAAAVKRYVATDPRAIGYVDVRDIDDTVRVILKLE